MSECYISVIYQKNVILCIPLPCWNRKKILDEFGSLNSIKYHINSDNDIVVTDTTFSQKEPLANQQYITIQTLFGKLFIPLVVISKDEDDIKESMLCLSYSNQYSKKLNENTLSIDY
jgi:hypothetical protein